MDPETTMSGTDALRVLAPCRQVRGVVGSRGCSGRWMLALVCVVQLLERRYVDVCSKIG